MSLDLRDCSISGPALPEPFVNLKLEDLLRRYKLLPLTRGKEGEALRNAWEGYRRRLRELSDRGGAVRVFNHVIQPLVERLGFERVTRHPSVVTREADEDGGWLLAAGDRSLRVFTVDAGTDLDAPSRRGQAYRFSAMRVAARVLEAKQERLALISDGSELRLLICEPGRTDSHIAISLARSGGWRGARELPDSFRLVLALASAAGVEKLPEITEEARLNQTTVTETLRLQARRAVERFVQEVLDHPANADAVAAVADRAAFAHALWSDGLVLVYRLLFVLKLESTPDPARGFSFASSSLWRNTYSPSVMLARLVRRCLAGVDTGGMLEAGLRTLFRLFAEGLSTPEISISPMGGILFGANGLKHLDRLRWSERGVAQLLDQLLWTPGGAKSERLRVHYGTLDVEELGRVYEALLELDAGIAAEPMCRLRRAKLEVVVPAAQGEPYRPLEPAKGKSKTKAKVEWIEEIPAGRFYLRVGLGRKASGSYYTPHPFVKFLVQETLAPQVAERSPADDPRPAEILKLRVLDPAMGSGHFLVEACRFLGRELHEACRRADALRQAAEARARRPEHASERQQLEARATELYERLRALPDPDASILAYLPSRVPEGASAGISERKAEALCRRLVAVHCLYGVDKNPLAVELAKVSLWLESFAEGLPLTFLDHRLLPGDSLTGPSLEQLLTYPGSGQAIEGALAGDVQQKLKDTLAAALSHVRDLEATVGKDLADIQQKAFAKEKLDEALAPFLTLAAAWTGGVMLGAEADDGAYLELVREVAARGDVDGVVRGSAKLEQAVELGRSGNAHGLVFPEVFYPGGILQARAGFHAVVGNPPWEGIDTSKREFYAAFDLSVLDGDANAEPSLRRLEADPAIAARWSTYSRGIDGLKRVVARTFQHTNRKATGASAATPDLWQPFAELSHATIRTGGRLGLILPSAFHANESAVGIRSLYLHHFKLEHCFSFENRKKLFDIDSRQKFAAIVGASPGPTESFECGFYLQDLAWLFNSVDEQRLTYSLGFLEATTGAPLNFLELRDRTAVPIAEAMYRHRAGSFESLRKGWSISPTEELHTSKAKSRTRPLASLLDVSEDPRKPAVAEQLRARGVLPVCKGEHFHQYDSFWGSAPETATTIQLMAGKERRLAAAQQYRFVFRRQASSTNERTAIGHVIVPGQVYFDSALPEATPGDRRTARALLMTALFNSFSFDWLVRQVVAANVTFNFLNPLPVPALERLESRARFLAHAALRLTCKHTGYAALWHEQLPGVPPPILPVIDGDTARWAVRASIDAVIARAYGLSRSQYEHVLASFSHKSYPAAPDLCLAAFDELVAIGLDAYCTKHDPYHAIPLTETLPEPVIDLGVGKLVVENEEEDQDSLFDEEHAGDDDDDD